MAPSATHCSRRIGRICPRCSRLLDAGLVKGMAHITGGGITDNLPRVLPDGCAAAIDLSSWEVPQIFRYLQDRGHIPADEMFRTFNMGVGLILVCAAADESRLAALLTEAGERPISLGGSCPAKRRAAIRASRQLRL